MSNVSAKDASGNAFLFTTDTWTSDPSGASQILPNKTIWGSRGGPYTWTDDVSGQRLPVKVGDPLPAGTNAIGSVTQSGAWSVQQSGAWTTGRTWNLSSVNDAVAALQSGAWSVAQSGAWSTGRTWNLGSANDAVASIQSGAWSVQQSGAPWSVSQSGAWSVAQSGAPWSVTQSGTWSVSQSGAPWSVSQSGAWSVAQSGAPWSVQQSGAWSVQQSGTWTTGRTWNLGSANDAVAAIQSGAWSVSQSGAPWSENISQFAGSAVVTGTGAGGAGVPRFTTSYDSQVELWDGTNTAAVKASGAAAASGDTALVVALSPNTTGALNLTAVGGTSIVAASKGVSGSAYAPVQQPKDTGRAYLSFVVDRATTVTTEALASMTINRAGTTSASASYAVTTGKTLRLQALTATFLDSSTVAVYGRVRVRSAASSLVTGSPIVVNQDIGNFPGTAAAGMGQTSDLAIPDGLELAGGTVVGISHVSNSASGTVSVNLIGYEY